MPGAEARSGLILGKAGFVLGCGLQKTYPAEGKLRAIQKLCRKTNGGRLGVGEVVFIHVEI